MRTILVWLALLPLMNAHAQYKGIIIEEINNSGAVPGKTYRIYVEVTNVNDQVDIIFGDATNPMEIKSTKPFYQCPDGGSLSTQVNRKQSRENEKLRYDSWLTIGAEDNYDNNTTNFLLNLDDFEKNGGPIISKDGAWFCIPTFKQVYAAQDKKILIMQVTTEGKVTGTINISGKTAGGETFEQRGVTFACG